MMYKPFTKSKGCFFSGKFFHCSDCQNGSSCHEYYKEYAVFSGIIKKKLEVAFAVVDYYGNTTVQAYNAWPEIYYMKIGE